MSRLAKVAFLVASSPFGLFLSSLAQTAVQTAVVHIRVDTAYDDSPASLMMLDTLAKYAPVRSVSVQSGETIASIFVREYGFGPSNLPKSYSLLIPVILSKNHLARTEDLRPGSLILPLVPKRALMGFNPLNLMNSISNMTTFRAEVSTDAASLVNRAATAPKSITRVQPSELAYSASAPLGQYRLTAPYELLAISMPLDPARELIDSKDFNPSVIKAGTFPIPIKLAVDGPCDIEPSSRDHQTLSVEDAANLSNLLTSRSVRAPVVFILDTGWPNFSAYLESRASLYDVLDRVWFGKFGIHFPKTPAQKQMSLASNEHCRCIERALKELRSLDQGVDVSKQIKVIYVPLTREQGASTVLTDLLQTSNLLQRLQAEGGTLNGSIIGSSRKYAEDLVRKYFPARWIGEEVQTDKSVLDAILLVGQAYAELEKTVFFANESWTVGRNGKYYVQYQSPEFGLVTAASGNDGTTTLLDFAQRSTNNRDTAAIVNMTRSGVYSNSTRPSEQVLGVSLAAGFDGFITDDISGTSFAAPRVAWLLAAGEAVRVAPINRDLWGPNLQTALQGMYKDSRGYQRIMFDPLLYVQSQTGLATRTSGTSPE